MEALGFRRESRVAGVGMGSGRGQAPDEERSAGGTPGQTAGIAASYSSRFREKGPRLRVGHGPVRDLIVWLSIVVWRCSRGFAHSRLPLRLPERRPTFQTRWCYPYFPDEKTEKLPAPDLWNVQRWSRAASGHSRARAPRAPAAWATLLPPPATSA